MREKGTQPCLSCLMLAALCFQSHEREKKPPLPPRSRDSSKSGPRKALSENTQRDKVWVLLIPVDKGNCSLHGDITWHNQALREFYTTETVQLVRWHASLTQCRQALSWTDWQFLAKETAVCVKTSKFCSTVSSPESSEWCSTWHHQAMRERWNDQFHRMSPGMRDGVIGKFHWMLSDLQKRTEKFHSVTAGPEEWMGWLTAFSRGNDAAGVQTGKFHRMSSSSGTQNDKFLRTSWSSEKWTDEFHRPSSGSERWTINFSGRRHALRDGLMSFSGRAIIMLWELGWSVLTGSHQADGWADLINGNCSLCEHSALRGGLTSLMEGNGEVSREPCKLYLMTSTSERWTDHAKAKHVCHDLHQFVKMSLCVRLWIFWGADQNECHIKNVHLSKTLLGIQCSRA